MPRQSEVSEESTRLARRRQHRPGTVADYLEFAEDPELHHASSAATFRYRIPATDYAVTTLPRQLSTPVPTQAQTEGADVRSPRATRPLPQRGASNHGHFLRQSERAVRPLH